MSAVLDVREEPGKLASVVLAAAVHVLLFALLIYGIRWQTRAPAAVEVELVRAAPAPSVMAEPPAPPPEPKPQPRVEAKPEPKPAPAPAKPDIALKAKEKPKPMPKVEPKPMPKVEPKPRPEEAPAPKTDPFAEQLKRDTEQLARRKDLEEDLREAQERKAAQATDARNRALADYQNRVAAKIRGNLIRPPELKGNPEAVFMVTQLPDGTVFEVKLRKSSGIPTLDAAIERAILKSSPLPKPAQENLFSRSLELKFRPLEE